MYYCNETLYTDNTIVPQSTIWYLKQDLNLIDDKSQDTIIKLEFKETDINGDTIINISLPLNLFYKYFSPVTPGSDISNINIIESRFSN